MYMVMFMKRIKEFLNKLIKLFLNWHFVICFGIAWMITNGWAYVFIILGSSLDISWMFIVGTSYVSFLWMPFTPEKLITIPLAILLLKLFFPKDEKTKKDIENLKEKNNGSK